ncbi:hypothetical protein ACFOPX_04730 [Helicobacter baculiformis]|uniref:Uncharacterized protein n=1 Tax=Helicobacter baculiformis TaxID=427351 RepID=A0ABV7ZKQ7_9HELI|nr:hypothetical protein [Helicobacter baculiformis]
MYDQYQRWEFAYDHKVKNPLIAKVRQYWEDYAQGLKRDINEVVQESLGGFVQKGHSLSILLYF